MRCSKLSNGRLGREQRGHAPTGSSARAAGRDSRTQTIAAALAALDAAGGQRRGEGAAHLVTTEDELLALLRVLRFDTGRGYAAERQHAADLMAALGLLSAPPAPRPGRLGVAAAP